MVEALPVIKANKLSGSKLCVTSRPWSQDDDDDDDDNSGGKKCLKTSR